MLKIFFLTGILSCFLLTVSGQQGSGLVYDPAAPAEKEIQQLAGRAALEKKHILVVAGGNWCGWCMEFERFRKNNNEVDSLIRTDYLLYHLNYSPENQNKKLFTRFGYPQRLGFPVVLVLNEKGSLIHTQKMEYLEQGRSYNKRRLIDFLKSWNRAAFDPSSY